MILTTIAYLKKDGKTLLLHRIKKKKDINEGKWIGVGGKLEPGESPDECVKREILEETGYTVHSIRCHGYVTFPGLYYGEDEGMFVYSCHDFEETLKECDEGVLEWVDDDLIPDYPQWEADYHFLNWMEDDHYHHAKVVYKNDELIEYKEEIY